MKPKKTVLFILVMLTSQLAFAQVEFNFGPEVGIAFSRFPLNKAYIHNERDQVKEKTIPLFSPLLGFQGQLVLKERFQFTAGIQYQKIGVRYYEHRSGTIYNPPNSEPLFTYVSEEWENQIFHKLCLPLAVGYTFRIGKIQPSVFMGVRPNLFLSGKYDYKLVVDRSDEEEDRIFTEQYDPVDEKEAAEPLKRINNQVYFGISTIVGERFKINLTYGSGAEQQHSRYEQPNWEPYYKNFTNRDIMISVVYLIQQ